MVSSTSWLFIIDGAAGLFYLANFLRRQECLLYVHDALQNLFQLNETIVQDFPEIKAFINAQWLLHKKTRQNSLTFPWPNDIFHGQNLINISKCNLSHISTYSIFWGPLSRPTIFSGLHCTVKYCTFPNLKLVRFTKVNFTLLYTKCTAWWIYLKSFSLLQTA